MDCLNLERDGMATDMYIKQLPHYYIHSHVTDHRTYLAYSDYLLVANYLLHPAGVEVMKDCQ